MTREEYLETVRRIQAIYKARRADALEQLEVEQEQDLLALIRVWKLMHDGESPPWMGDAIKTRAKRVSTNGHQPPSQKQKIRRIIEGLTGAVDSKVVIKRFGEIYIDDKDKPESSTVSKVFREMTKEGILKCTKPAGFQQPAQFVKT
ncbi:MAG TPA: hypothetical protein VLL54_04510 [Pyrinomonadaceae bacterium]|nr:hypothetical protein [Pyrinomonadaceae bacterium]